MISLTFDLKIKKLAESQKEDAGGSEKPVILLLWPKGFILNIASTSGLGAALL